MKRAYAKINIGLDIKDKRDDGYHNIDTFFYKIDLYDEIKFELNDDTIIRYDNGIYIEDDLMIKAQKLLEEETGKNLPFRAEISKNIPIGAGLAGGSTDCAEAFLYLNEAYKLNLNREELMRIGSRAGADVPFFISGLISARGKGIGDDLSPIDLELKYNLILIKPDFQISTKEVYMNINQDCYGMIDLERIKLQFELGEIPKDLNIMEGYAFKKYPILEEIKKALYEFGAEVVFMSGSGPTMVGMFRGEVELEKIECLNYCKIIKANLL